MSAEPDDDAVATAAAEDAAFASGFPAPPPDKGKTPEKAPERTPEKVEAKAPEAAVPPVEKPEYVRVTRKQLEKWEATSTSHEGQLSKAWGTIGNLQKVVNDLQAKTPAGGKVPKAAFEKMARDFPELAEANHEALEAVFASMVGTGGGGNGDTAKWDTLAAERKAEKDAAEKAQLIELQYAHPRWREIVGAVPPGTPPDAKNPFRKWLASKGVAYESHLNESNSASVIGNAIVMFQIETKGTRAAGFTNQRDDDRSERIREAVQPRGDHQGASAGPSDDEEFLSGFNSR